MESQEEKPSQKPRVRMRSVSGQLQRAIDDLDLQLDDPKTTQAKKAVIALKKADVLLRLAEMVSQESRDGALAEVQELTTQLGTATQRIAELDALVEEASRRANTRTVQTIPDPETPALRKANETLQAALSGMCQDLDIDTKARIVVRAALKDFESAKPLIKIFKLESYPVQVTLMIESLDLQMALGRNPNSQYAPINRAVLSIRDGFNFKGRQASSTTPDFEDGDYA